MSALRFVDLECEVVTPTMIGGAGFRPEVRPPTFRGLARRWIRSLAGGVLGDDLSLIRQAETAVLGGSLRASPVAVRGFGNPAYGPLPTDPHDFPGVQYMYWAAYSARRECLLPGERFRLRVQTRPYSLPESQVGSYTLDSGRAFDLSLAALWLALRLDGFGYRSRRAAGCLRCLATPDGWPTSLPSPASQAGSTAELAAELAQGIDAIRRFPGWDPVDTLPTPTSFDILHPDALQLFVLDRVYPTWWEALDAVGQNFKAFRLRYPNDYQGIRAILTRQRAALRTVFRSIFGLPLAFFYSSLYRELANQGVPPREARARASAVVAPFRAERRASPLVFRVCRLVGDEPRYGVLLGLWRSQFLSEPTLVVRPRDRALRPVNLPAPLSFAFVEEYLVHLGRTVAPLIEVAYH